MKTIFKLALVALVANATWHAWGAYAPHFKFKDAVQELTQFAGDRSDDELRSRIVALGAQYDVPITEANFTLTRKDNHTVVDGEYVRPIELAPGFTYPWTFKWHVDTFNVKGPKSTGAAVP